VDDSGPALDRNTNRCEISTRFSFGGDQQIADRLLSLTPFAALPGCCPGKPLGYSWPPHLYQGSFKLVEKPASVNRRKVPVAKQKKMPGGVTLPAGKKNDAA
jgi:hypothetical protein